jgi:hypothetical protein
MLYKILRVMQALEPGLSTLSGFGAAAGALRATGQTSRKEYNRIMGSREAGELIRRSLSEDSHASLLLPSAKVSVN